MKKILYFLVTLVLLAGLVGFAPFRAPLTYFVSISGNDQNFGTQTSPWRSIQKCANTANIGDTCNINSGNYNERVIVSRSGITFQAVGALGSVTMKGFTLNGANNTVQRIYVFESTDFNAGISVFGSGNIVRNNKIERARQAGIHIQANNVVVEGNEILRTLDVDTDGDGIRFFGDGNIIRGNYIHDLTYQPGDSAHRDCFQTWGTDSRGFASNTLIEGNTCDNRQYLNSELKGQGFMMDGNGKANNITIRNNVIRSYQNYILNISGLKIENNTFEMHQNGAALILQNDTNTTLRNNIFYSTTSRGGGISMCCNFITPTSSGQNYDYRTHGTYPTSSEFTTIKGINPLFVNPSAGDFHLQPNSPMCTNGQNGGYAGAYPCGNPQTPTVTPTVTKTPVSPTLTATPSLTPVFTGTASVVPPTLTRTPTRTATVTRTVTQTSTSSVTPSITMTPTTTTPITRTVTFTPRPATPTPTPSFNRCDFNRDGRVSWSEFWRCIFQR